jgi:hypothetical protein
MSEWQPIETAPKDGTEFLAFQPGWELDFAWWDQARGMWMDRHGDQTVPTHWIPLPPPPEATS